MQCGLQRSYSMTTLSGAARSLLNVHATATVRVQATCAGWPGRYRVKSGVEPYVLFSGGGGSCGVIVGEDEVQEGRESIEGCRAALPARAQYALVFVSDWWHIGAPGRCVSGWTRGHGAISSRMVGGVQPSADRVGSLCFLRPLLGVLCSLKQGRGCWCWKPCTPCRCPWVPASSALASWRMRGGLLGRRGLLAIAGRKGTARGRLQTGP